MNINVGTPGHIDHGVNPMFNNFKFKLAAAMGIAASTVKNMTYLPPSLPYVPWVANTGKRRTGSTRVNHRSWKCNRMGKNGKKVGHKFDIISTMHNGTALVKCRRCNHTDIVPVKVKAYTQNKTVAKNDPERIARAVAA